MSGGEQTFRGGSSFPPGSKCLPRRPFRFNEGVLRSADETVYIGNAVEAHHRAAPGDNQQTGRKQNRGRCRGYSALAGAWFSPFSAGASVAAGRLSARSRRGRRGNEEDARPSHVRDALREPPRSRRHCRETRDGTKSGRVAASGAYAARRAAALATPPPSLPPPNDAWSRGEIKGVVGWFRGLESPLRYLPFAPLFISKSSCVSGRSKRWIKVKNPPRVPAWPRDLLL